MGWTQCCKSGRGKIESIRLLVETEAYRYADPSRQLVPGRNMKLKPIEF